MEGYNTLLRLNLENEIQKKAYAFIMNRPNKKESISSYISNIIVAYEGALDRPSTVMQEHEQLPVASSIDFKAMEDLIRTTIKEVLQDKIVSCEKVEPTEQADELEEIPEETITDIAAMLGL